MISKCFCLEIGALPIIFSKELPKSYFPHYLYRGKNLRFKRIASKASEYPLTIFTAVIFAMPTNLA